MVRAGKQEKSQTAPLLATTTSHSWRRPFPFSKRKEGNTTGGSLKGAKVFLHFQRRFRHAMRNDAEHVHQSLGLGVVGIRIPVSLCRQGDKKGSGVLASQRHGTIDVFDHRCTVCFPRTTKHRKGALSKETHREAKKEQILNGENDRLKPLRVIRGCPCGSAWAVGGRGGGEGY